MDNTNNIKPTSPLSAAETENRIKQEFGNARLSFRGISPEAKIFPSRSAKKILKVFVVAAVLMITNAVMADYMGFIENIVRPVFFSPPPTAFPSPPPMEQLEIIIGERLDERIEERLEMLLGEDGIANIRPVEFTDFLVTDCGLSISFVAVNIHRNMIDIFVELEDLVCNRLEGGFLLNHSINPIFTQEHFDAMWRSVGGLCFSPFRIISRDAGAVMLHASYTFGTLIDNIEIEFTLHNIYFNAEYVTRYPVLNNIAGLDRNPDTMIFPYGIHENPFGSFSSRDSNGRLTNRSLDNSLPLLVPHQSSINFDFSGEESISGAAIIDNRLHVQIIDPPFSYNRFHNHPQIGGLLLHQRGLLQYYERMTMDLRKNGRSVTGESVAFFLGNNGEIIDHVNWPHLNWFTWPAECPSLSPHRDTTGYPRYREFIFELDMNNLDQYTLYSDFLVADIINIGWSMALDPFCDMSICDQTIVISNLAIHHAGAYIYELTLTPLSIRINGRSGSYELGIRSFLRYFHNLPNVYIHLTDGTQIPLEERGSGSTSSADPNSSMRDRFHIHYYPAGLRTPPGSTMPDLNEIAAFQILGEVIPIR